MSSSLNDYEILGIIGDGRYCTVHEASSPKFPCKRLALKALSKSLINNTNPNFIERELHALKRVSHLPNIPLLLEYFENGDNFYFVLELIDGFHLQREITEREVLQNGNFFSVEEKKDICLRIYEILKQMHALNVYHGDLKLENVIVELGTNEVKLVDFGCSIMSENQYEDLSKQYIGTPGFSPPEILQGLNTPVKLEHLDLWGLCNIFYYLFTRKYAFGITNSGKTLQNVRDCLYDRKNVPKSVIEICDKVFIRSQKDRISLDELARLIREFKL